jgi:hypothetical protein
VDILPFILPVLLPIMLIPIIIGIMILRKSAAFSFSQMVGILTLKPLIATPLWLNSMEIIAQPSWGHPIPDFLVLTAPGIILTLVILLVYHSCLRKELAGAIVTLLILDGLRWSSSSLSITLDRTYGNAFMGILSFIMPTIFAIIALWLAKSSAQ